MEPKYVNELKAGERVESVFLVADKQLRRTRADKPFLSMRLMDRTGTVDAVAWENAEELYARFEKGDVVGVRADVESYQGASQLRVAALKKAERPQDYAGRFVPVTDRDTSEMLYELRSLADTIADPRVRTLVKSFLDDPEFSSSLSGAPAAKGMHHVFVGGLIQHTLKVARLCHLIHEEYARTDPGITAMISRDVLIAGAILHDIGKLRELDPGPGFDYTTEGRLVGHISLGLLMLKGRMDAVEGFPADTAALLMHLMLAHHGEYEFGSPKRPKSMEAFILHYADNLDAKLQGIFEFAGKDQAEGAFTSYHRLYERYFFRGLPPPGEDAEG